MTCRRCERSPDTRTWARATLTALRRQCQYIGDASLRQLASHCPHLRTVLVSHCKRVSDVGVRVLGQGCPELATLGLAGLPLLSDGRKRAFAQEGLRAMAQSCTGESRPLRRFVVRSHVPLANQSALRELDVTDCFQLAQVSVADACVVSIGPGGVRRLHY